MTTQKEQIAVINTELKYINEKLDENVKAHKELKIMLSEFMETVDSKYARKQVESIVYSMIGLILVAFLTALIKVVIATH